jgi:hypothetical protein
MSSTPETPPEAAKDGVSWRCEAGPCGFEYETGGSCTSTCCLLVDDAHNHLHNEANHSCYFGHSF